MDPIDPRLAGSRPGVRKKAPRGTALFSNPMVNLRSLSGIRQTDRCGRDLFGGLKKGGG